MIDRGAQVSFTSGLMCGGAPFFAAFIVLLPILTPWPGGNNWSAFIRGATVGFCVPAAIVVAIGVAFSLTRP